ncbi:MAG: anaerobic ribonucleoside-triphosphate reductase activating protein [Candidatus Micrarchaeota archaeon]
MLIKGFVPLSLIDYPGKLSCILFLYGCNIRCSYCQNPQLVLPSGVNTPNIEKETVMSFLEKRKGKLEGVVISGGEPCINPDLPEFLSEIRSHGYSVKLDTNGLWPERLKKILDEKLADYIAMDVKAPLQKYEKVVGVRMDSNKISQSIEMIKNSGINYEFRTTVVPRLLNEEDLMEIGETIKIADSYYLQQFEPRGLLDPRFELVTPYPEEFFHMMKKKMAPFAKKIGIRGMKQN